jgi:hypothetical protein
MKTVTIWLALTLASACGWSQCHKAVINTSSPEGKLLQRASDQTDPVQRIKLLEEFASQYPQHEAIGWVYEQLLQAYYEAKEAGKALAMGEKLAAIPPECVETAQQTLKAAELKNDPDLVRQWAAKTAELAQKVMASPQPAAANQVENWKSRVDYAKQVNTYTEYADYAMSLKTSDPAKRAALIESLEQRNPKSEYLGRAYAPLVLSYVQSGATDKAVALAQKAAAIGQADETMLLLLADAALRNKDAGKVYAYSAKAIEVVNAKAKPQGVSDADWQKLKTTVAGRAHYLSGKAHYNQGQYEPADQELRAALPVVESDPNLRPEVLYLLGYANYKLEKIHDAAEFYKTCAAVKSPYQAQAAKNLRAIRAQQHGTKR